MKDGKNIPVSGMTDAHPLNIKDSQYPLMLNGNIMTDISSAVTLTNEHSNYLCNNLPDGFKVIGTMFVHEDNVVYLWLVNPVTTASQIGYLSEYVFTDVNDEYATNPCDDCVKKKEEAPPLETTIQPQLCVYTPIVTDGSCCTLNFNIDFPIRKGVFKKDNCGDSIYFTDFRNPPRVLKLQPITHLPDDTQRCVASYTSSPCVEPIYDTDPTHVDCLQIQIFPTVAQPHVTPTMVGEGGVLLAGVYQLAVCYADKNGQRATRTFVMSNPASIFDINKTVTDQVNYPTDRAIQFTISNLTNTEYYYIDIFVVATINGTSTVRQFDTIDITSLINDSLVYVLSDFEKGKPATIDDVLQVFPVYELAQEITTADNALLLANLTGPPDLNLQQAVIGLSPFLQWKTYESTEALYADGAAAADFRTFMRDEVYPIGIVFERNNTLDTCVYPFIGRGINTVVDNGTVYGAGCPGGYVYVGYWLANGPSAGVYAAKAIVSYGNVSYVNTSGATTGPTDIPGSSSSWTLVTSTNASTYCIVPDNTVISNSDTLLFPGCSPAATNLRWQVYNTAFNRLTTCNYSPSLTQCVQRIDNIVCNSFVFSLPTISYSIVSGVFSIGNTITGVSSGATGTLYSQSSGILVLVGVTGTYVTGENITNGTAVGLLSSYVAGSVNNILNDCYLNRGSTLGTCADNYTIAYTATSVEAAITDCVNGDCCPNPYPAGCNPGFVRSLASSTAGGAVPLCVDSALATYDANYPLSHPYAINIATVAKQVSPGGTSLYNLYPFCTIVNSVPWATDPTPALNSAGTPTSTCVSGIIDTHSGQQIQAWLWNGISSFFNNLPTNYLGPNAAGFQPNPDGNCTTYQSPQSAPLIYFLGDCLPAPADAGCGAGSGVAFMGPNACAPPAAGFYDYWGTGGFDATQGNSTIFQSYWYNFTATSATALVIKVKMFYKDIVGGFNNTFEPGDLRIDVYEGNPFGTPLYSTGNTSATYYYDNSGTANCNLGSGSITDVDTGVLIIGDVANSTGDFNAGAHGSVPSQTLLQSGTTYYVHIYLLARGRAKLNVAPLPNPNGGAGCPCYLPEYAWANICINSPSTATQVSVTTPAEYQMQCTYDMFYRVTEVLQSGCEVAPYEFGDFAYWQAETKTYPTSTYIDQNGVTQPLWGQLCGLPIRHFKFPDCLVSPIQDQDPLITGGLGAVTNYWFNSGRTANIYPIGLKLNTEDVKTWLNWAVSVGLISASERSAITGYKIVRGNRATNKSIAAKGLLSDMWKYNEYDWVSNTPSLYPSYFANYPFNDLVDNDPYLSRGAAFTAPGEGISNNRFAFHSPETSFNSPTIGDELKLEAVVFGSALGNFYQVLDHPKYILLSEAGIVLASVLAGIQLAADLLVLIGELLGNYNVGLIDTVPVGSTVGIIGATLDQVPKFFIYAQTWETLITNFGVPQNYAYYYAAVGNYHSSGALGVVQNSGNKRRLIANGNYLLAGNLSINEQNSLSKVNNYEREDSVYLHAGNPFTYSGTAITDPVLNDTSKFIMSGSPKFQTVNSSAKYDPNTCGLVDRKSQVAAYYASMKYYLPDQYGSLQDIEWLYTGVFEPVDWNTTQDTTCDVMLGGDEFIVRFTKYIKIPFFLDNPVGTLSGVDFQYHRISNITNATYYFNSVGESVLNSSSVQFTPVEYNFDCDSTGLGMYLKGNMYLFNYGIMSFLCESDFNLNFRRCTDIPTTRCFYPYQSDVQNATQEYLVPIETPNNYLYNRDYSKQNKENFFCTQPTIYHNQPCVTTYRNRVINSIPDTDNDFYRDNWKIFLGGDFFDFPLTHGFLNGLDGVERDKVMVRFADTTQIFNAYYTIDTNAGSAQLGTASLFANKPEEEVKSDVGFGGTESHAFISTPIGHFWVDTERHKVFMLPPSQKSSYAANNPVPISDAYDTFFLTNLPFYILQDFPTFNVDNPYKDIGMAMDWDYRYNRLFLTKLDYKLLPKWKGLVQYVDDGTGRGGAFFLNGTQISLEDPTYFCNKSWTISYSPGLKSWISFYSFIPNYYIGHAKYLQTGVNYLRPGAESYGVWNHFISNKSYQVFYGTLYPFTTDVVIQEQLYNKQLLSVEYQADFLRFQNDYDYYYNPDHTFNKMVIWTENQNSGNLTLVPQKKNDLSQGLLYPIVNPDSTSILVTRKTHNWRVNQFADLVANKHNNVPPMILGCSPYMKTVNPDAINYQKPTFQRQHMTSDYFTMRFTNDIYSNYKIINKWFLNNTIKSYS